MDPALAQIVVGALVTIVSQYVGYQKLRRLLEQKADRKEVDERFAKHEASHAHN